MITNFTCSAIVLQAPIALLGSNVLTNWLFWRNVWNQYLWNQSVQQRDVHNCLVFKQQCFLLWGLSRTALQTMQTSNLRKASLFNWKSCCAISNKSMLFSFFKKPCFADLNLKKDNCTTFLSVKSCYVSSNCPILIIISATPLLDKKLFHGWYLKVLITQIL